MHNYSEQDQSALNVSQLGTASHAFDLEAEAEPIPDLCDEPEDEGGGGEDDFNPDMLDQEDLGEKLPGNLNRSTL